jgi:hypothetical protein
MLKKIQTDMRSELNNDTICCLICAKQNQDKACFEYNPSDNVLRAAKKAVLKLPLIGQFLLHHEYS